MRLLKLYAKAELTLGVISAIFLVGLVIGMTLAA